MKNFFYLSFLFLCVGCAKENILSDKANRKLADFAYDRHDYEEAEKLYRKAHDPRGCAKSLLKMQRYQEACDVADQTLVSEHINGKDIDMLNLKGVALSEMGKLNEAVEIFNFILTKESHNITALNNLGLCLILQKKFSEAEKVLKRTISKYERSAQHENAFQLAKRLNSDSEGED